jgi:uncharacterized membrane protein (UPF0127 family)
MIAQLLLAATLALAHITVAAPHEPLDLEVADTFQLREHGLMNRTWLAPKRGMIFVFYADGDQNFWMKNTLIPLDMIFVASDGTVTSVAANVPASTKSTPDDKVATRRGKGKYVIELRAGEAERAGIHPGIKLAVPDLQPKD